MRNGMILVLGCAMLWACEEKAAPVTEQKPLPVPPVVTSAAVTASPPAASVDPAKAAASEAQKAVEENPLTPCCRALGRKGFNERSPEYTAASQDCGKGMEASKTLAQITSDLKKALKGKSLPDECVAK